MTSLVTRKQGFFADSSGEGVCSPISLVKPDLNKLQKIREIFIETIIMNISTYGMTYTFDNTSNILIKISDLPETSVKALLDDTLTVENAVDLGESRNLVTLIRDHIYSGKLLILSQDKYSLDTGKTLQTTLSKIETSPKGSKSSSSKLVPNQERPYS